MSRRSMRAIITTFKIEILESKSLMQFRPMLAKLLEGKTLKCFKIKNQVKRTLKNIWVEDVVV